MTSKQKLIGGIVATGIIIIMITMIMVPTAVDFYSDNTKTIIHDNSTNDTTAHIVGDVTSEYVNTTAGAQPGTNNFYFNLSYNDTSKIVKFANVSTLPVNQTVTTNDGDININITNISDLPPNESVTVDYTYSSTYGIPSNIVNLIAMIIVLIFVGLIVIVVKPFD